MGLTVGKRWILVTAACLALTALVFPTSGATAAGTVDTDTDKPRYVDGERIIVRVTNGSSSRVRLEDPIEIVASDSGEVVATYHRSGSDTLSPGEVFEWNWDQWEGECRDDCPRPEIYPPRLVGPGRYIARAHIDEGTFEAAFSIGQYFTLGFREGGERYGIFSFDPATVAELKKEAEAQEKSLIVSGTVVRGRADYNTGWPFFLRPRSIVTGEVFTERCDARPGYVARHLSEWAGETWCPWSSYVLSVGTP